MRGKKLNFDILSDEGNAIAAAFGLRHGFPDDLKNVYMGFGINLDDANGEPSWTLPMPGRFIVDQGGIIRDVRADVDYTRRPEPDETVASLAALG